MPHSVSSQYLSLSKTPLLRLEPMSFAEASNNWGNISANVLLPLPYIPHRQIQFFPKSGNGIRPLTMASNCLREASSLMTKSFNEVGLKGLLKLFG